MLRSQRSQRWTQRTPAESIVGALDHADLALAARPARADMIAVGWCRRLTPDRAAVSARS